MSYELFDLIVIGGGPGGYVAAIRGAQLGLKTALIEKTHLGGVCLNWGCIPTKALLKSAEMYDAMRHAQDFGIDAKNISFDLKAVVKRSRDISEKLTGGIRHLMKKNGVHVVEGHGRLEGKKENVHQVSVSCTKGKSERTLAAPHVILATGARARILKGLEPDSGPKGKFIWTAREAMVPEQLPQRLLVVGSGAIGLEFTSFYHMLGSHVHVVEMHDVLFPVGDPEVSTFVHQEFHKRGVSIHTKTTLESWEPENEEVRVRLKSQDQHIDLMVDRILVAAGIVANTEDLGLETTRIQLEKGHIVTHGICETDEPGIYAIGDVASGPWLAHKASHEGILAVEHIKGLKPHPLDPLKIPGCVYSTPQIASIGLTEPEAKAKGHTLRIGRFPFMANGKALTQGKTSGFVKAIFDEKTGEILGAHLVGPEVTELISNFAVAQQLEGTEEDLVHTVFPHPTLSESLHEVVLNALQRGLHF